METTSVLKSGEMGDFIRIEDRLGIMDAIRDLLQARLDPQELALIEATSDASPSSRTCTARCPRSPPGVQADSMAPH